MSRDQDMLKRRILEIDIKTYPHDDRVILRLECGHGVIAEMKLNEVSKLRDRIKKHQTVALCDSCKRIPHPITNREAWLDARNKTGAQCSRAERIG